MYVIHVASNPLFVVIRITNANILYRLKIVLCLHGLRGDASEGGNI